MTHPDAIVLFSGGLDSLLASLLLKNQGLAVLGVHFISPFFGNPKIAEEWQDKLGIPILSVALDREFAHLFQQGPGHGFGKHLNPCIDCKIIQLRAARKLMREKGASFLATGEVPGQRPMSQRHETLQLIQKKAGVADVLLRPLSALLLPPTAMEERGLVERSRLRGISGRGRNGQLELARELGLKDIPTPGGGCRLTEKENSRRYWQILKFRCQGRDADAVADDFRLSNLGRQFWREADGRMYWLSIGRNAQDNAQLLAQAKPTDATLKLRDHAGPLALARDGAAWPEELIREAASLTASFVRQPASLISVKIGSNQSSVATPPQKMAEYWQLPAWETVREEIRQKYRRN